MTTNQEKKEKALLEFFNWTLDKIGKDQISKVEDYEIFRKDLIENLDITSYTDEWENIMFPSFTKSEIQYFKYKKMGPTYVIAIIKYGLLTIGKTLEAEMFKSTRYTVK